MKHTPVVDAATLPRRVPTEANIALIAPAGPKDFDVKAAERWVNSRGHTLKVYPGVLQHQGYLAGSDDVRLKDLHDAFADPEIDAIICLRGGYGTPRLLDRIDYDLIGRHVKPFIGYSDLTALHLAFARYCNFVSFHGPMLTSDLLANRQAPTEDSLRRLLRGQLRKGDLLVHPVAHPLTCIEHGVASGRLTGGNLSMICATLATAYEIDLDGAILFIEDVGEPLYRVDRLLTHLRLAGRFKGLRGVLVGDFAGLDVPRLTPLLKEVFGPLGIPVLAGWRSGHCDPNLTLPLNTQVRLDAGQKTLMLEQDVVR
ncbi:S66 peptidase family protein [Pseudomonas putida]